MEIQTKHFGTMEYIKEQNVHFPDGLFGFESYKDYFPIPLSEDSDAVICMQSVDDSEVAFITMNPFFLSPSYQPLISDADRKALGDPADADISYYCICVLHDTFDDSSINLKCPLAINALTRVGRQLILEQPEYSFRHYIRDIRKSQEKEGA